MSELLRLSTVMVILASSLFVSVPPRPPRPPRRARMTSKGFGCPPAWPPAVAMRPEKASRTILAACSACT